MNDLHLPNSIENPEIAIIGMTGRFPEAKDINTFWENLRDGVESISVFSDQELESSGIDPAMLSDPNYVKAGTILEGVELFDANFFGFSAREAEIMDPQHRLFLECASEAIESAGYNTETYEGAIGVYAGVSASSYLLSNLYSNRDLLESVSSFLIQIGNDKDFLPTRVSYKLNLKGPSINVQTACSTSLVAVHLACQSLLNGECDIALAGGVSIRVPQKAGYLYQQEGILSPDGHCRAFDAKAQGTVGSNGVGIVVLKRLEDALADGDCIHAIIKGSAINNDGFTKVGYTAPSVDGQAAVISEALTIGAIEPETVTYVEAHGTGTSLGDPIEIAALTQAFRIETEAKGFCAIGSLKTNVGHLDAAAGVAGLIKTVLALKHKLLLPSLHFEEPNPKIDFTNSPFYVNTSLSEWKTNGIPRRAGVSSFGIGGTNAHVVLEEAPIHQSSKKSRPWQLLVLSAKTRSALETATIHLADHLKQHPDLNLADVAYTLQIGRQTFDHRRMVICRDLDDGVKALTTQSAQRVFTNYQKPYNFPVVFMFPGQGSQYVNMGRELYQNEPIFAEHVDNCCQILRPHLGLDLCQVLYPSEAQKEAAQKQLKQTFIAQPALFVIEYALAQLWMAWGVYPEAMIGHSIGEYVAATLAGVFSLEDALALVAIRGRLMQQLPPGAMLSVALPEQQVQPLLEKELSLAASNEPSYCVVSGPTDAVEELQQKLQEQGIRCRQIHVSHAFHSQMMNPVIEPFTQLLQSVQLNLAKIPFVSNVSGTWITTAQATDPNYWARHLRQPVRFSEGITELLKNQERILLEVGPGRTLSTFTKQHCKDEPLILTSLRHPQEQQSDVAFLLNTLGRLWLAGVKVNWSSFYANEQRHRLPLPTYPFERQRYWIEPQKLVPLKVDFKPRPTESNLWNSLVKTAQIQADKIKEFDEQTYLANKQWLNRLCTACMNVTLRRLGAFSDPNKKYSIEEIREQCQIIPRYRQLLCRWLDVLVEQGQLRQTEGLFSNLLSFSTDSFKALVEEVRTRLGDKLQAVDAIEQFGENLADLLVGKQEPLELFVAFKNKPVAEVSDSDSPTTYYKAIMRAILEQVVQSLPLEVNLRILEIGGGQGVATAELLPVLPSKQTNYTFTDIGVLFLNEAQQKFNAYPFVEYRLLDIEQLPQDQGYSSHSFDVVIAYNVLHVTRNIEKTLQHVRSLLAPNGLLLIWEMTQPQLDFDITWGLLMNPLEDEERSRGNPFLSKKQWDEALHTHEFVKVETFPEIEVFGENIMLAQASTSAVQSAPAAFTTTFENKDVDQIAQVSVGKKLDISDWFYIPSWKRLMPPKLFSSMVQTTQPGCWLAFVDKCGLGEKIVQQLVLLGQDVITVKAGEQFGSEKELSQTIYTINPRRREDYDALLKELRALNLTPKTIVHLWNLTSNRDPELTIESLERSETLGFLSLVFLVQALAEQNLTNSIKIGIVSNNLQEVTGEEILHPEKAFVLGPCKVIEQEYPNIVCCSIDVVIPVSESSQDKQLINQLLAELTAQSSDRVVAYRGFHRWGQTFEPVHLNESIEGTPQFREEGVYLITGGLGGVGLLNAEYLAKTVHAKLILIGRSAFPNRDEWSQWLSTHDQQDSTSLKIQKLQVLETLGAEVLVLSADVTDREQMNAAIAQAKNRFGQIHGVIHNAQESKQELIAQKTLLTGGIVLTPKVVGTLILDEIFKDVNLDFFVLASSQASIVGGIGLVEYSAKCAFLDAFAHYTTFKHGKFIKVMNWNRWNTAEWVAKTNQARSSVLTLEQSGLTPEEGMEAFKRILFSSTMPQIVVSNTDFNKLIHQNLINLKDTLNSLEEQFSRLSQAKPTHPRPNLGNAYVAPGNEIESTLAEIWQHSLGIEQVGIYDNFFELGGDSLLATVVLTRLRQSFEIELPYQSFFNAPTIAELAEAIIQKITEQADHQALAQTLAEIQNLSEEEVQLIIASQEHLVEMENSNE